MVTAARGEAWNSVVGALRLERTVEQVDDGCTLVRISFRNTVDERMETKVVEDVPKNVRETSLVTSAGGDPDAWRVVDDSIVHDVTVPGGETRRTAYLVESIEDDVFIPPPRIRSVEPAAAGDLETNAGGSQIEPATGSVGHAPGPASGDGDGRKTISLPSTGTQTEPAEDEGSDRASADGVTMADARGDATSSDAGDPSEERILDALLAELDGEVAEEKADELRATLGLQPSEQARLTHLRGRLEELAAYTDALEVLVDEHGLDAITEMREDIDDNADRTAALGREVDDLADVVERNRSRTVEELGAVKADLAKQGAELEEQLADLSEQLEAIQSDVTAIREASRRDRQVHARDVRRIEATVSELTRSLEAVASDVEDLSAFRDRFRAAFNADAATDSGTHSSEPETTSVEGRSPAPDAGE